MQKAVARGLQALTLWKLQDGRWQANASDDRIGWRVEHDAGPVQALQKALSQNPIQPTPSDEPSVFD
ncbi:hypothetical protein [Neorhizobium galegae]|uniref:hypothetical protein n=1 Tax=Neorhizobium galegae TaxID=399 RepID=UPI0012D375A3|nr:hypothetical protein [Neorhizobium galegae]